MIYFDTFPLKWVDISTFSFDIWYQFSLVPDVIMRINRVWMTLYDMLVAYVCQYHHYVCRCDKINGARPTVKAHWGRDKMAAISLKFVPKGPMNNISALVQIMAWRRPGDKPLSERVIVSLLTHICVTRPQWVDTDMTVSSLISQKIRICAHWTNILQNSWV